MFSINRDISLHFKLEIVSAVPASKLVTHYSEGIGLRGVPLNLHGGRGARIFFEINILKIIFSKISNCLNKYLIAIKIMFAQLRWQSLNDT